MSEQPFVGISSFLKAPINDLSRKIGIVGIPYDGSSSYRPGARFAPNAVRKASMMLTDGAHPLFETVASDHVTDFGDIVVSNVDVWKSLKQIKSYVADHPFVKDGKPLYFIGGDHTVSFGILSGLHHRAKWKTDDLCIIHLDSHGDVWSDHFGFEIGHGTWLRQTINDEIVSPRNIVQIGIRSPVDKQTRDWLPNLGGTVLSARTALKTCPETLAEKIKEGCGNRPVYISFDIDAIDPSMCPGTGTPEISGLTTHWVLDFLESLKGLNIVGMDVVEVSPAYDVSEITSLTAATILWTVLSMVLTDE